MVDGAAVVCGRSEKTAYFVFTGYLIQKGDGEESEKKRQQRLV